MYGLVKLILWESGRQLTAEVNKKNTNKTSVSFMTRWCCGDTFEDRMARQSGYGTAMRKREESR
jgi:hypothetical protein